jgi:hypothetical protein
VGVQKNAGVRAEWLRKRDCAPVAPHAREPIRLARRLEEVVDDVVIVEDGSLRMR